MVVKCREDKLILERNGFSQVLRFLPPWLYGTCSLVVEHSATKLEAISTTPQHPHTQQKDPTTYLAHYKQVFPGYRSFHNQPFDGTTNCPLISIKSCTIQMPVPTFHCSVNSIKDIIVSLDKQNKHFRLQFFKAIA